MNISFLSKKHLPEIQAIFNDAIENTSFIYETKPRTKASMKKWFTYHKKNNFPIIGIIDTNNELVAFGTYGFFREKDAYHKTIENSVYVKKTERGKGYGFQILEKLIELAQKQGFHAMISVIDSNNAKSLSLHKKFGFHQCGTLSEIGYKNNDWLTILLLEKIL